MTPGRIFTVGRVGNTVEVWYTTPGGNAALTINAESALQALEIEDYWTMLLEHTLAVAEFDDDAAF